jgi:hypothetical protein
MSLTLALEELVLVSREVLQELVSREVLQERELELLILLLVLDFLNW